MVPSMDNRLERPGSGAACFVQPAATVEVHEDIVRQGLNLPDQGGG